MPVFAAVLAGIGAAAVAKLIVAEGRRVNALLRSSTHKAEDLPETLRRDAEGIYRRNP